MLIFIALLYFSLACGAMWLVFFPASRAALVRRMTAWRAVRVPSVPRRDWAQKRRRALRFLRRHSMWWLCGAVAVLIPSLIALMLSNPGMLPAYEGSTSVPDEKIAALLQGEQLAPPQALPPMAFSTLEVEQVRPMLADASRNWSQLRPDFSQRLLLAFKIMKEKHGYDMALLEGYRSPERQNLLASMGSQVSNARAFQSWHQYGLAADCAFLRDGKLVISEKDPWAMRGYQLYGEIAESLGLTWGGRWTMMDFGHVELRVRGVMQK